MTIIKAHAFYIELDNPARLFPGPKAKNQKSKNMWTQSMSRRFYRYANFAYWSSGLLGFFPFARALLSSMITREASPGSPGNY